MPLSSIIVTDEMTLEKEKSAAAEATLGCGLRDDPLAGLRARLSPGEPRHWV